MPEPATTGPTAAASAAASAAVAAEPGKSSIVDGGRRLLAALGRPRVGLPVLLAVLAVALVIGSGLGQPAPSSAARAAALETQIRCPSCQDVSVADSAAPTAITVRHDIERWAAEGRSDQAIENILVARYGESILLSPPGSGLSGIVWLVPLVAGIGAVGAMTAFFWRRSRDMARLRRDGRT